MDFLEFAVPIAGKLGLVSAEFVIAVLALIGGYKLYNGNKVPTDDTLTAFFHSAGIFLMFFGGFGLVGMLCIWFAL